MANVYKLAPFILKWEGGLWMTRQTLEVLRTWV